MGETKPDLEGRLLTLPKLNYTASGILITMYLIRSLEDLHTINGKYKISKLQITHNYSSLVKSLSIRHKNYKFIVVMAGSDQEAGGKYSYSVCLHKQLVPPKPRLSYEKFLSRFPPSLLPPDTFMPLFKTWVEAHIKHTKELL